jgi:uncharacterized protein YndB with AHSA1/START domain
MRPYMIVLALALTAASSSSCFADVQDASATSFRIRQVVQIAATPAQLYRRLINVGAWWDPENSYSGKAANLSLKPVAGGCFCERLPRGSVQHMQVVYVDAPKRIVLSGALGPLQTLGVVGALTMTLDATDTGTRLGMSYNVGGNLGENAAALPAAVDAMLRSQLARLKQFAEQGVPRR